MADREDVLARHKAEKKELQGECQRLKHSVPKGDKKRKKEVTEQIARLESEQEAKHKQELLDFETISDNQLDGAAEALSGLTTTEVGEGDREKEENCIEFEGASTQQSKKHSRAQKRRDKKSAKDREREDRVKEAAISNLQGPRHQENIKLQALLRDRGLKIYQIPSDGNCMYNAVKHQLNQRGHQETNESLRRKTADLMQSRQDDFLPFLTHHETGDPYTPEQFHQYCEELASTTAWGGHLELQAMSESLSIPMEVVQAEGPKVTVGEEYSSTPVTLVYHRHALGLGEHYNSVEERGPDDDNNEDGPES